MKKALLFSTLFLITGMAMNVAAHFKEADVSKFETTNRCTGCDLSSALLSYNHSASDLTDANLSGIRSNDSMPFNFSNSILINANFSGAMLKGANFSQTDCSNAHFEGADLSGANFFRATDVNLSNASNLCDVILPNGTHIDCK